MALESPDSTVDAGSRARELFPEARVAAVDELEALCKVESPDWSRADIKADGIAHEIRLFLEDVSPSEWKWSNADELYYQQLKVCSGIANTAGRECDFGPGKDSDTAALVECQEHLAYAIINLDTIRNAVRPDYTLIDIVNDMNELGSTFAEMTREEFQVSTYCDTLVRLDSWIGHFEKVKQSVDHSVLENIDMRLELCNQPSGYSLLVDAIMGEQGEDAMLEIKEVHDRIEGLWRWVRKKLEDVQIAQDLQLRLSSLMHGVQGFTENLHVNPACDVHQLTEGLHQIALHAIEGARKLLGESPQK